ncbi:hypothetical protein A9Q74_09890 [Colwellia sp. 39_35_sub15_T18]|nr:hypothetical protein A9Q74_09890 [Colwellia sp. 39_35_sub15_T18]
MALPKRKQPICAKCKSRFSTKRENAKNCPKCIEAAKQPRECKTPDCTNKPDGRKYYCINCNMSDFWNSSFGRWLFNLYDRNFTHIEQIPEDEFMVYEFYKIYKLRDKYSGIYFAYDKENMSDSEVRTLNNDLFLIDKLKGNNVGKSIVEAESIKAKIINIEAKLPSARMYKSLDFHICHLFPSSNKGLINTPENLYIAHAETNHKLGKKDHFNSFMDEMLLSDYGTCRNFYEKNDIKLSPMELKELLSFRLCLVDFQRVHNKKPNVKSKVFPFGKELSDAEVAYNIKKIHKLECKRLGIKEKIEVNDKLIDTDAEMVLTGKIEIKALNLYLDGLRRDILYGAEGEITGYQIIFEDDKCTDDALTSEQQALKDSGQLY